MQRTKTEIPLTNGVNMALDGFKQDVILSVTLKQSLCINRLFHLEEATLTSSFKNFYVTVKVQDKLVRLVSLFLSRRPEVCVE